MTTKTQTATKATKVPKVPKIPVNELDKILFQAKNEYNAAVKAARQAHGQIVSKERKETEMTIGLEAASDFYATVNHNLKVKGLEARAVSLRITTDKTNVTKYKVRIYSRRLKTSKT